MEAFADGAVGLRHLGDLREHGAFPVRLVRARGGARGRLRRGLLGSTLGASLPFGHFSCPLVQWLSSRGRRPGGSSGTVPQSCSVKLTIANSTRKSVPGSRCE